MICGCCKDLGCFTPGMNVEFGINSLGDLSNYVFHVWTNGGYSTISESFPLNSPIVLPFTFNENGETTIKIEIPSDYQSYNQGLIFATTPDGACCFTVHGIVPTCS